jgi:hypothetical protein
LGLTKLVTSIRRAPACRLRRINSSLSAVVTSAFSFCRPSRGPTSTKSIAAVVTPFSQLVSARPSSGLRNCQGVGLFVVKRAAVKPFPSPAEGAEHVHLFVDIPPHVSVSEFVQRA